MIAMSNNPVAALTEYELRHLAAHLEAAGRYEELHCLLALETGQGRNAWYEARESLGQTAGYLGDIRRAWRLADAEFANHQSPISIGRQCRYALVITSINSLARSIPPVLLAALVEKELWTPAQGLAYARQIPDSSLQADAFAGLAPHLPEAERVQALREALMGIRRIYDEEKQFTEPESLDGLWLVRSHVMRLTELASQSPEVERVDVFREALAAALSLDDFSGRANALANVAPYLPLEMLYEAWEAIREIPDGLGRAYALAQVAPNLPETERTIALQEALTAARESDNPVHKEFALKSVTPHLPAPLVREALEIAREGGSCAMYRLALRLEELGFSDDAIEIRREITDHEIAIARKRVEFEMRWSPLAKGRTRAPIKLASNLSGDERDQVLREALAAARRIVANPEMRSRALADVTPHLPDSLLREALDIAIEIEDEESLAKAQAKMLIELASHLTMVERIQALQEALTIAGQIAKEEDQAQVLAELAPHLPRVECVHLEREALAMGRKIAYKELKPEVLAQLACYVPKDERVQALKQALLVPSNRVDQPLRAMVLDKLASQVPEVQRLQALREALMAKLVEDQQTRTAILEEFVSDLPELLLREGLVVAQDIEDTEWQAQVFRSLIRRISDWAHPLDLAVAREIADERWRNYTLAELAPRLAEHGFAEEALTAAQEIDDELPRANALKELAPLLSGPQLGKALVEVWNIDDSSLRAWALAALVPYLSQSGCVQALQEVVPVVRDFVDKRLRREMPVELAPHLPEVERTKVLREALMAAGEIEDDHAKVYVLRDLAPHLPEPQLREALAMAREIEFESARLDALVALLPRLAELGNPNEALVMVWEWEIEFEGKRAYALAQLAPHLPESLLQEALAAVWDFEGDVTRINALLGLAPYLPSVESTRAWQEALALARGIEDKEIKSYYLAEVVVPQLMELGHYEEALATARIIPDDWRRSRAIPAVQVCRDKAARKCALMDSASHLPKPLLREALKVLRIADTANDEGTLLHKWPRLLQEVLNVPQGPQARAMANLVTKLLEQGYPDVALVVARMMTPKALRAKAMGEVASYLTGMTRIKILQEALVTVRGMVNADLRATVLAELAPQLVQLPEAELLLLWQQALSYSAFRTRSHLLSELCALTPVITALGGPEAITETLRAIRDVSHWWP